MSKHHDRRGALGVIVGGAAATFAAPALAWHGTGTGGAQPRQSAPRRRGLQAEEQFGTIPLRETDFVLGNAEAPVTLIKYGSLTCPHCAAFHVATAAELKRNHIPHGQVRYVHRHFPLNQPAMAAAMLLHSGNGSQDRFYALLDILYSEQRAWASGGDYIEALRRIGARTGMNDDEFNAVLADRALAARIIAERDEGAQSYGVNATPTLLINGGRYSGNRTISELEPVFEEVA